MKIVYWHLELNKLKLDHSKQNELKCVLMMAGGTGGHVFPGLAVAQCLQRKGVEVHWLGTQQGLESRLVPSAGIPLHCISIQGLRGKGIKALLWAPFRIIAALRESMRVIKKVKPDIVIGMGGFVSGPGGVACWLMRCPFLIHEQNAKAGLTNKILSRFAARVLEGFPGTFSSRLRVITTGNPVRPEIENLLPPSQRLLSSSSRVRLLVLGGSLGAQALNELLPRALAQMSPDERPEVLHQTGVKHIDLTKKHYESMKVQANVQAFIEDMAQAYAWADLVLCRAGALTVAELCAAGLGAILVPFPYAVDDHQTENACFMVKHDAALCIQQSVLTDVRLADILREFAQSPEKRMTMAEAAYRLRQANVAERIVGICKEVRVCLCT